MADNFGLKIGLEGEKEFKKALSDINQSFKVLGSEMKVVQSQFDKNDDSVEALTSRNRVLGKEIDARRSMPRRRKSRPCARPWRTLPPLSGRTTGAPSSGRSSSTTPRPL